MFSLLILYVSGGILLIIVSLPLLLEKVKPNPFYSFRVPGTLENPTSWYAVNKYFARYLLLVGVVEILATVGLYFTLDISVDVCAFRACSIPARLFGCNDPKLEVYEIHSIGEQSWEVNALLY